ncbi:serine/threonine-protein kinase VRK1-like [Diorhabda sublineata]|uniref:serine/threonine-protein kinase VRK1-like n=1 Tax=Diorhabda sublineata TaxID=1163346 RepID=UPI0024E084E6|nr:serine/threonine-protein kinase VRK1-like [Diorhabda sublineata]
MLSLVIRFKINFSFCSFLILVILIMPKAAPKRKAANGYKLAEPLPLGEVLQDISKKQWKLGSSIGQGGFGAIYSAKEATDNSNKYPYVIKIEPHSNGPLFVEMHFYMRNCKKEDVDEFKRKAGLKTLGIPLYLGSGSHEYCQEKYRFVVMEKFGTDVWKIFLENNKLFPASTVFKIAIQMLDALEYIHSRGYVHADLKGANILMGSTKDTLNKQLYLVDFGLATKFNDDSVFKPNPKKAHDGTIEYLSRDAHQGVQTRRGDLEILAYNMIQWLGCVLPWEKNLKDPNAVYKSKDTCMSDVSKFMKTCFGTKSPPAPLVEFLNYLVTLKHNMKPDYKKIRKIFLKGLDSTDSLEQPFKFTKTKTSKKLLAPSPKRKVQKKKPTFESSQSDSEENDTDNPPSRKTPIKENKLTQSVRKSPRKQLLAPPLKRKEQKETVIVDSSQSDSEESDTDNLPSQKTPIKVNGLTQTLRKSPRKKVVPESSENQEVSDMDVDEDVADSPAVKATVKRKRKGIVVQNLKRKSPKKEDVSESSEDEKENDINLDVNMELNDSDGSSEGHEEVITNAKPKIKQTNRVKSTAKPKSIPKEGVNLNGYTAAMREILQKKLEKEKNKKKTSSTSEESTVDDMAGYTDTMKEIILKKQQRLARKGKGK